MSGKAVVLLSGGLDSSTVAAIARSEGYDIYALSFDYAQRHRIELESARRVAESLNVKEHLVIKFDLRQIGGSALTADIEVPKKDGQRSAVSSQKSGERLLNADYQLPTIPVTYVPARNTIFLSFALGWAEVLEAGDIFIGANAVDYSGYPDCRPEYLNAYENMANLATKAVVEGKLKFRVDAPLINMTKAEIIKKGMELGLDFSLTWSCYDPQSAPDRQLSMGFAPCGKCDSCWFRSKGFQTAGVHDPLIR